MPGTRQHRPVSVSGEVVRAALPLSGALSKPHPARSSGLLAPKQIPLGESLRDSESKEGPKRALNSCVEASVTTCVHTHV